jgi:hypothetical protein
VLGQVTYSYEVSGGLPAWFWPVWGIFVILMIASMWMVFTKAGKPGWASIIPFYNTWTLCEVAGRPGWWMFLLFIPFVNFVIFIIIAIDVAKNFGKGVGFGIGLILLSFIFYPILAFGSAQYQGGGAMPPAPPAPPAG